MDYTETETQLKIERNFKFWKQHFVDTCELYLTMLDTELAHDPYIKFVAHDVNYNFYLGHTAMKHSKLLFNFGQTSIMKMTLQSKPALRSKIGLSHEYKNCSIYHPRCV